jgi:putative chitinase
MKDTAIKMEAVRAILQCNPILVTSWFRSLDLNKRIGGVKTSQHTKGEAVDFICPSWGSPKLVCLALMDSKDILMYDQLILEPSWIHISFVSANPRMTELTYRNNIYHKGLL